MHLQGGVSDIHPFGMDFFLKGIRKQHTKGLQDGLPGEIYGMGIICVHFSSFKLLLVVRKGVSIRTLRQDRQGTLLPATKYLSILESMPLL